jgi:hypothetical protein
MEYSHHIFESICNIKTNMNTMYQSNNICNVKGSSNMYNIKGSTKMSNAKVVILVWDILELMSFSHHDARSLS